MHGDGAHWPAHYPEIQAYRSWLHDDFDTATGSVKQAAAHARRRPTVLWYLMGFFPRALDARAIVHDYRGLSVGPAAAFKDHCKRHLNHRPHVRIFLNNKVQEILHFRDRVPFCHIDMGVPACVQTLRGQTKRFDFCYLGEISRERGSQRMLAAFVRRYGQRKTFALIGRCCAAIRHAFARHANLLFLGARPHTEALRLAAQSRVGVCYFPYHRPHRWQTPTKLLEYAALHLPIVANDSPANIHALRLYRINAYLTGVDVFATLPDQLELPSNRGVDATSWLWTSRLQQSGIKEHLLALSSCPAAVTRR